MFEDITQVLIPNIQKDMSRRMLESVIIRNLTKKLSDGTATYQDAFRYATEIGNLRAKTIKNQITPTSLPNGKMYYDIARDVLNDSLGKDYDTIQPICRVAQTNKNKSMNIGLQVIDEEIDEENINNLVGMIGNTEEYEQKAGLFEYACATFAKSIVDRNMKANANFQRKLGIKIVVIREGVSGCCDYCSGLTGSYPIDDAPKDIWGHHNGCMCSVDYTRE